MQFGSRRRKIHESLTSADQSPWALRKKSLRRKDSLYAGGSPILRLVHLLDSASNQKRFAHCTQSEWSKHSRQLSAQALQICPSRKNRLLHAKHWLSSSQSRQCSGHVWHVMSLSPSWYPAWQAEAKMHKFRSVSSRNPSGHSRQSPESEQAWQFLGHARHALSVASKYWSALHATQPRPSG